MSDYSNMRAAMSTPLTAALYYAGRGWRVLPLVPRGKEPLISDWPRRATINADVIREWWHRWPNANIGGIPPGSTVDADGAEGEASIREHKLHLPPTPTVSTGDGYHRHYAGRGRSRNRVYAGIDICADGHYVVLPPSIHPNGSVYQWVDGMALWDMPMADRPRWVAEAQATPAATRGLPDPTPTPRRDADVTSPYGRVALQRAAAAVADASRGARNVTLNTEAYVIGRLIGGGEILEPDAVAAFMRACVSNALAAEEPHKTRQTLARGLRDGQLHPRRAPNVRIDRRLLNGEMSPGAILAGCFLAVEGRRLSTAELSGLAGITDRTARGWLQELRECGLEAVAREEPQRRFVSASVALLLDNDLTPAERVLWLHLKALADDDQIATVGQAKLSRRAGVSRSTLTRHVDALELNGWILVDRARYAPGLGRRLTTNAYVLMDTQALAVAGADRDKRHESKHSESALARAVGEALEGALADEPPSSPVDPQRHELKHPSIHAVGVLYSKRRADAAVCTRAARPMPTYPPDPTDRPHGPPPTPDALPDDLHAWASGVQLPDGRDAVDMVAALVAAHDVDTVRATLLGVA